MAINKPEAVARYFGPEGRLLSNSKSAYSNSYPDNKVYFNGNIFDEAKNKIWFGDIDVTLEMDLLKKLANDLNEKIYITMEHPYRWDGLKKIDEFVVTVEPDGNN